MFSIVINLTEAKAHTFIAKNGDTLLKFTFAKTKQPDKYGRTHTAYVSPLPVRTESQPETDIKAPAKVKKSKRAVTA